MKKMTFILFCALSSFIYSDEAPCTFEGMIGSCPKIACRLREELKRTNEQKRRHAENPEEKTAHLPKNRLLIYGRPGNGKTTLGEKITEESGSVPYVLSCKTIREAYSTDNINMFMEEVEKAYTEALLATKTCVLRIEDPDLLPPAAYGMLNRILDNPRYREDVVFVFESNDREALSGDFLNRFGSRAILRDNPDTKQRPEYLHGFCEQESIVLTEKQFNYLVKNTKGMSIRSLSNLPDEFKNSETNGDMTNISNDALNECLTEVFKQQPIYDNGQISLPIKILKGTVVVGGVMVTGIVATATAAEKILGRKRMEEIACKVATKSKFAIKWAMEKGKNNVKEGAHTVINIFIKGS